MGFWFMYHMTAFKKVGFWPLWPSKSNRNRESRHYHKSLLKCEQYEYYEYRKWPLQSISRLSIHNHPIQRLNAQEEDSVVNKQSEKLLYPLFSWYSLTFQFSGKIQIFLDQKIIFQLESPRCSCCWRLWFGLPLHQLHRVTRMKVSVVSKRHRNSRIICVQYVWYAMTWCSLVICQSTWRRLEEVKEWMRYSTFRAKTTKSADCISFTLLIWLKKYVHI